MAERWRNKVRHIDVVTPPKEVFHIEITNKEELGELKRIKESDDVELPYIKIVDEKSKKCTRPT